MGSEEFQHFSKSNADEQCTEKFRYFRNTSDKKSQNSLKQVKDNQENIAHRVFEILSQSSLSTNVDDLEDVLILDAENTNPENNTGLKPQLLPTYDLRSRTVTKQQGKKGGIQTETLNAENLKRRKHKPQKNETDEIDQNETEMEICSQESVSMLQGLQGFYENYKSDSSQLVETTNVEMTNANNDEENVRNTTESPRGGEMRITVENSTQTEFPMLSVIPIVSIQRESEITKHTNFVGCIVRLKAILSSKENSTDTKLQDILHNILNSSHEAGFSMGEADKRDVTLSKETIEYTLRSSDTDNIFRETVRTLLSHLENIIKEDFLEIAACWRNSVYEMTVDMLNEAVDCDPGIRKMVEVFLCRLLESISCCEGRSKNLVVESKVALVMTFCKSTYLAFTSICYIIGQLKRFKREPRGRSFAEKLSWSNFVKNSYFLLRILEVSLESVKSKLRFSEIDKLLNREREVKNFNVLELWKKQWRVDETSKEGKTGCQWKLMMCKWSVELDEVLINYVSNFPISAIAVERCKRLVIEILKICYPDERENETTNWIL